VLDKGEVKEIGNHQSLLEQGGYYARLYQMQFEKQAHPTL
jgi:ATP-binding cassette subfamily B protein